MKRLISLCLFMAALARAQEPEPPSDPPSEPPSEPPSDADEGDYTLEVPDSLANDELEFTVGAASDGGSRVRRSQRVSFKGGGTRGTLRDGDDALSGGRVAAPFAAGTLTAGRLAPRWGRGLVLGGATEPWARQATEALVCADRNA